LRLLRTIKVWIAKVEKEIVGFCGKEYVKIKNKELKNVFFLYYLFEMCQRVGKKLCCSLCLVKLK